MASSDTILGDAVRNGIVGYRAAYSAGEHPSPPGHRHLPTHSVQFAVHGVPDGARLSGDNLALQVDLDDAVHQIESHHDASLLDAEIHEGRGASPNEEGLPGLVSDLDDFDYLGR